MAVTLKRSLCGDDCSVGCSAPLCFGGAGSRSDPFGGDPTQCTYDLLVTSSQGAPRDGMYTCAGSRDDKATLTWPGGSQIFTSAGPSPCFGAGGLSIVISLLKDDIVTCLAESWGGPINCTFNCCYLSAP